jgi:hypothetical protein
MQLPQGVRRDPRFPERHASADASVEHPLRQRHYDAGLDLDMDYAAAHALLAVLRPQAPAVERVPAIVNFNFLPDMGRMNRQWWRRRGIIASRRA